MLHPGTTFYQVLMLLNIGFPKSCKLTTFKHAAFYTGSSIFFRIDSGKKVAMGLHMKYDLSVWTRRENRY